ncbi:hypothetical protein SAMN05216330_11461 [Bradyrhizobium sp. Ghvi]|nr:hypothetical protein SAMN05216330_11461 [Bradyrhizobium sp. Ghvi]
MQNRICRAEGNQQLLADRRQSRSMAYSFGLLRHHVGCCGVVAARKNSKALRPSSWAIVSCFADSDINEAVREGTPLAPRALLSGSCRSVQKAAVVADARHRQSRLTHTQQGGHSQPFGGQDSKTARAPRERLPSQRSPVALGHRHHTQPKIQARSSWRCEPRGSGSLSGSLRIDRVVAHPRSHSDAKTRVAHSGPVRPQFNLFMAGEHGSELRHA